MKNQNVLLAAALLALGAASCQKEEKVVTQFTAGMEQSSAKTYLGDDSYFYWESTDKVRVYSDGATNGADFDVAPRSGNGTWAVLSGTIAAGGSYTAIYPAGIAASATSVTLPAVQNSADGSLAEFPMYAESTTDEFQFKNLCGALRIHLQASDVTISRIKVKASSNINGTYSISVTDGIPQLGDCTNGTATTTLILGNAQSVSGDDGRDFYIYLPAGEYSSMQLTFCQPDGTICTKNGSNVTVERSKCTPVEITNDLEFIVPEGCTRGLFSVSDGEQVRFSQGNLQYVGGEWRFAAHQYDYLGAYSATAWDLFGWSTSANNNDYGRITSIIENDYTGEFVDWGHVFGADSPWRTLEYDQWVYLLNERSASTVGSTSDARYAEICVHDDASYIRGLLLFPDVFVWPSDAGNAPSVINAPVGNNWNAPLYDFDQFSALEAAGAAFLPAAGYRYGGRVINGGVQGNYWSSSAFSTTIAYYLYFDEDYVGAPYCCTAPKYGHSVRLVQDAD